MPLREDILQPIPGDNPSGIDLRYDKTLQLYDRIREARRQDEDVDAGVPRSERKTANFLVVARLSQDAIATVSKDLQLASWLTEALLQTEGFDGLCQGLQLCRDLVVNFWDTVYPVIEDGDLELRSGPLSWIGLKLDFPVRARSIVKDGYSWINYKDSRLVGYEADAKTEKQRNARAALISEGKIAPDIIDKSFAETSKEFYSQSEKSLDACLEALVQLNQCCNEKFTTDAPSFSKLQTAMTEVRQTIHFFLEKKRESDPDPVDAPALAEAPSGQSSGGDGDTTGSSASPAMITAFLAAEPSDRQQAVASVAAAAAFLRKREPLSPAPYLLLRGLRWGELRTANPLRESALLEAPPTEVRQQIKRLALAKRWADLLEAGELAMALPSSRAWLDLQRLSVTACAALGPDYSLIATAIKSQLRALLSDIPELLEATLLDDTPAANPETRIWLRSLEVSGNAPDSDYREPSPTQLTDGSSAAIGPPTWLGQSLDPYVLAKDALASGREERAFAIMNAEVARQNSGRQRFRRTMQMIELALAAGRSAIAQPLLDDVAVMIETHKLDAWESPEQVASDLLKVMRNSNRIQANAGERQKLFDRICRLDPVLALGAE